jgi:hypothetical protein
MQINSSLTALGNLLAQITADNAAWSVVTEAIAAVQSVSAVTPDAEGRNTVVVVGATGYNDQESFTYTRRGLGDSVNPAPTAISLQGTESAADVAKLVAAALGLVQSEVSFNASFINADGTITLPAADGSVTGSVQIVSASGSLLYVDGSTLSLNVNFPSQVVTPPAPTLAALTTVTALSGFSAAAAPVVTPPASTDGTSSTGTTGTDGQASGGTTPPAADGTTGGTTPPAADGTGSTTTTGTDGQATGGSTPAADGTTSTPSAATDGTAAAGTTTPAADGTTSAPAATDGTTPAAPAADGQASQAAAS